MVLRKSLNAVDESKPKMGESFTLMEYQGRFGLTEVPKS